MAPAINIEMRLPAGEQNSPAAIAAAVNALVASNLIYLAGNPRIPPLARAGIKYRHEKREKPEQWLSIPEIIARKTADCKSLAAWRIAELNIRGIQAEPYITNCRNKTFLLSCGNHYHVAVRAMIGGKFVIIDPSKELGM